MTQCYLTHLSQCCVSPQFQSELQFPVWDFSVWDGILSQLGLNMPRQYVPPPNGTIAAAVRTAAAKNFPKIPAPLGGDVGQRQYTRRTEDTA